MKKHRNFLIREMKAMEGRYVEKSINKTTLIKWAISVIVPSCCLFIPTGELFTVTMRNFVMVTVFSIFLFGFEIIDTVVGSLILTFGYVILNVAPMSVTLAPWTGDIPWMMVTGLLLVAIVQRTSILKRVAYFIAIHVGGQYIGIIMGMVTVGMVISLLVPSSSAAIAVIVIAVGLCEALNLRLSLASAGIMVCSLMGFMDAYYFVYSPTYISVLYNAVAVAFPVQGDYLTFFQHNAVFVIGLYLKAFIIAKICKPKNSVNGKSYFLEQRAQLAPMNTEEKKILFVLIALVIYLLTYTLHGQSMLYGFVIAPVVLYLPGFNVGTSEDVKNINFSPIFFAAACLSIGNVAASIGVGTALSEVLYPLLSQAGSIGFLAIVWIMVVAFNFAMTPVAEMAAFGLPLAQMCADLNIGLYPMMYTFFQACSTLLLPYEAAWWLVMYSFGMFKLVDFVKLMGVKAVFDFAFLMLVGVPYWSFLGIL